MLITFGTSHNICKTIDWYLCIYSSSLRVICLCLLRATGPLRDCPNLLCTPNAALYSEQGFVEMKHKMAEEIRRGLLGQVPKDLEYCVNKIALSWKPEERLNATSKFTSQIVSLWLFSIQLLIPLHWNSKTSLTSLLFSSKRTVTTKSSFLDKGKYYILMCLTVHNLDYL